MEIMEFKWICILSICVNQDEILPIFPTNSRPDWRHGKDICADVHDRICLIAWIMVILYSFIFVISHLRWNM